MISDPSFARSVPVLVPTYSLCPVCESRTVHGECELLTAARVYIAARHQARGGGHWPVSSNYGAADGPSVSELEGARECLADHCLTDCLTGGKRDSRQGMAQ